MRNCKKKTRIFFGWIEVPGTNISYPVLQTTDNDFYVNHNYKKEYSERGSVFLDKDVDLAKPSTNFLIYGHRSQAGIMFEELMKYDKEDFYKENPNIKFTTLTEDVEYEIISVFYSRVFYKSEKNVFRFYYFVDAENEADFNYYVNESKKLSKYDTGKTAEYGEQLLTLITCSYHVEDGRFVIVAKKTK